MGKLSWGDPGTRLFETGVDQGVLYTKEGRGVPWVGLISVSEEPSGGELVVRYVDGVEVFNRSSSEKYEGTIQAYTYPDEFEACEGMTLVGHGLLIGQQRREPFSLSYRTKVGNDLVGLGLGYKIHIVYNGKVKNPTKRAHSSISSTIDPPAFSWSFSSSPVISGPSLLPTAHIVLDSRRTDPAVMKAIEDILYGTATTEARLPDLMEIISFFPTLQIVDNGDGTWTATGTDYEIQMLSDKEFKITSEGATYLDEDTYTLKSVED